MRGFPNQVADLEKLATGMSVLLTLVRNHADAKDDGVFGQALVRAGVAGTGHRPQPVDAYLRQQLQKRPSDQSFRTTARGLRELFRLLRLISDAGRRVEVTVLGHRAASFAGTPMSPEQIEFWRKVVRDMVHEEPSGQAAHPYQILLRLVARRPGITRAKCALALEAQDDSPEELERIVALANLEEAAIPGRIGVSRANWDNAKKILPRFAEQLLDVIRSGHTYVLADAPGLASVKSDVGKLPESRERPRVRTPRASRAVTPETIGRAGIAEAFDEVEMPLTTDPEAMRNAVRQRLDRLRRHNLLVRALATRLQEAGARLYEDPFDLLALVGEIGILGEVKTLDGSEGDERDRVKEALAQLLYYEAFVTAPVSGGAAIRKVACFEREISGAHRNWLNEQGIASIWSIEAGRFVGDALARRVLGPYLEELT